VGFLGRAMGTPPSFFVFTEKEGLSLHKSPLFLSIFPPSGG